jgi:hypothetical protein
MGEQTQANTGEGTPRVGEFLVGIGAMSEEQVQTVLAAQQDQPDRLFGEIAIEKGFIDDSAIKRYLDSKFEESS